MIEEWNCDQIYGIMEGGSKGIEKINKIIFVDKQKIIEGFLEGLKDFEFKRYSDMIRTLKQLREKYEGLLKE